MEQYSPTQRAYYAYLGRALAFTYFTKRRRFLSAEVSSWLMFIPFALALVALVLRWGWSWIGFFLLIWIFIRFSYWRARKMGYNQFVPDREQTAPQTDQEIDPNRKIAARASGAFALSGHMETVLLRQCSYWYVPLGDHVIMVQWGAEQFLYQFFNPRTLQFVQKGWILFGEEPLDTLAITFLETWGPDHNNNALQYFVGGGQMDMVKLKPRTIYLSFADAAEMEQVWATLRNAAAAARAEAPAAAQGE
jgi:hypothetical protein